MLPADHIKALTAENFKLAAGSCDVEGGKVGDEHGHFYCSLQAKVEAQAEEIDRLREELDRIAVETGRDFQTMWVTDMARAALEKKP
jgi:hypothetical protein